MRRTYIMRDFVSKMQDVGVNTKKFTPAIAKDMITREVEIGYSQMVFEKEKVKSEIMREMMREKEKFRQVPDALSKKIRATMDMAIEKMRVEGEIGLKQIGKAIDGVKNRNRELTIARARAQIEIEKLKKEVFEIKNSEQFNLVKLYNKKRRVIDDNRYLGSEVRFMPPENLIRDKNDEDVFPMDMYEKDRYVKGEDKMFEDAYYRVEDGIKNVLVGDYKSSSIGYDRLPRLLESEIQYIHPVDDNGDYGRM